MKILLFLLLIIISFNQLVAKKSDVSVTLEDISDSCQFGRKIIFQDYNNDDVFDRTRITNCDLSYKLYDLIILGNGELLSGFAANIIEGDIDSNIFKLRIYDPYNNKTAAYFYYDKQNDNVVLDYSINNVNNPYYNEIQIIISTSNNNIELKISNMSLINNYNEVKLFDINGRELELLPNIEYSYNYITIDVSNLKYGFYILGLKSGFNLLYYKLLL